MTAAERCLIVALLSLSTVACQSATGPDEEPDPGPALRRNASVILRRIDIIQACDGRDLFGDPRKGDFAYRIRVRENPIAGTPASYTHESGQYGDPLGSVYLRGPGSNIDLNDRTYDILALSETESVTISLSGIEWDIVVRDSDMNGGTVSQTRRYPGADGIRYYELDLGSGDCHIELEYAIRWTTP